PAEPSHGNSQSAGCDARLELSRLVLKLAICPLIKHNGFAMRSVSAWRDSSVITEKTRSRGPYAAFTAEIMRGTKNLNVYFRSQKECSTVRLLPLHDCSRESSDTQSRVLPRHSGDLPPACASRY